MTENLEKKIREIIDKGTPKTVTYEGKKVYVNKDKIKEIKELETKHEGGILPLAALLPLIFAGVTAAGATAASVANVVKDAKESKKADAETELANAMKEKISGSGIFLDRYQGNSITKYLHTYAKYMNTHTKYLHTYLRRLHIYTKSLDTRPK